MAENKQNTVSKVESLVRPFADELGLKIWDIRYLKEGASWFLRIFIDKEGGVDIDDCERLSRAIDEPLDTADIIKDAYFLEVSSPGLFRELTRPEHFEEFEGVEVPVIGCTDEYLTHLYGDYMKKPVPWKRASKHFSRFSSDSQMIYTDK